MAEHRRHAPNCPFFLQLSVSNIPLSSNRNVPLRNSSSIPGKYHNSMFTSSEDQNYNYWNILQQNIPGSSAATEDLVEVKDCKKEQSQEVCSAAAVQSSGSQSSIDLKPQQPLLDSVFTSEELLTVLGQLNALKRFVHANIHQNGSNSYQSSEKGRLQVKNWPFESILLYLLIKLVICCSFRRPKCKNNSWITRCRC